MLYEVLLDGWGFPAREFFGLEMLVEHCKSVGRCYFFVSSEVCNTRWSCNICFVLCCYVDVADLIVCLIFWRCSIRRVVIVSDCGSDAHIENGRMLCSNGVSNLQCTTC